MFDEGKKRTSLVLLVKDIKVVVGYVLQEGDLRNLGCDNFLQKRGLTEGLL